MSPDIEAGVDWPDDPHSAAVYGGRSGNAGQDDPAGKWFAPERWRLVRGSVSVLAQLDKGNPDSQARIIMGFDPKDGSYICAGVGGHKKKYVIDEWKPVPGVLSPIWVSDERLGSPQPRKLRLELRLQGRALELLVDGAPVIARELTRTVEGTGLGLFAWGDEKITFTEFRIASKPARAVVVLPFEGFDDFYNDLIVSTLEEKAGLRVESLKEHALPENILQDIRRTIRDADLVVAEISKDNANVFYEVGYAYASNAPTLLLVNRGRRTPLPFDVRPERYIRYDLEDGKEAAEADLVRAVTELGLAGAGGDAGEP